VGATVAFRAELSGGRPPFEVSYSGLPPACPNQNSTAFPCRIDFAGVYRVELNAADSLGAVASAVAVVEVDALPQLEGVTVQRSIVEAGDAVSFTVTSSGGAPPVTYSYAGLPPGCVSSSTTELACLPVTPGTYDVNASMTDSLGATSGPVSVVLHVRADLALSSLTVSPASASPGDSFSVNLSLTGGVAPYVEAWSGVPSGCNATGLSFACVAGPPGNYAIGTTVMDADGHTLNASVTLVVSPSVHGSGGFGGVTLVLVSVLVAALAIATVLLLARTLPRRPR
jgi:hypothetical protein